MPRARPPLDGGANWKFKTFTPSEFDAMKARLKVKLRPFFPGWISTEEIESLAAVWASYAKASGVQGQPITPPAEAHPADSWVAYLVSEAQGAINGIRSMRLRRTNEELRAEYDGLLASLTAAEERIRRLSGDLDILLGADPNQCRVVLAAYLSHVKAARDKLTLLPKARTTREVDAEAAREMAIRCLRVFQGEGGKVSATASTDFGSTSTAIQILKALGDEFGVVLSPTTWKRVVTDVKLTVAPAQQEAGEGSERQKPKRAPAKKGAVKEPHRG